MKKCIFLLLGLFFLCQTVISQESATVSLFGKNLENADFAAGSWEVNDQGELYSLKSDCAIWTKEKYGSFVCSFEFQTSKGSNSGFLIHSHDRENWIPNSMEIQLADDAGGNTSYNSTAAFYGYQAATKNMTKPAGQWNKMIVTCLGTKVTVELNGEKIDVVEYSKDLVQFIKNALSPAKDVEVYILDDKKSEALAVAEGDNLSLAIGKKGQNVKLAARLTKCKIDVKTREQVQEEGINIYKYHEA